VRLPIVGGASSMGDLPAVASGEGWVLPMSDSLTQIHGQVARATTAIQTPPPIGRCCPKARDKDVLKGFSRGWCYPIDRNHFPVLTSVDYCPRPRASTKRAAKSRNEDHAPPIRSP
jgi:hypothetical protein